MERRKSFGIGLLDNIFGVSRVAGHAQRGAIELVKVFEGVTLETLRPLGFRLFSDVDGARRIHATIHPVLGFTCDHRVPA